VRAWGLPNAHKGAIHADWLAHPHGSTSPPLRLRHPFGFLPLALTVRHIGALPDLDNITVRIADIAAL
jgi:hypothetical protein